MFEHATPPRIPPRHHILRQPLSISHLNSHETVIELTQVPNSPLENKMSINVSTRSPNISFSKGQDCLDSNISKLQITSSANSPLISKTVTGNSPSSISNSGNYFMRGAFKSSSVNYGNYMRRTVESSANNKLNGSRHGHHSPQLLHMSPGRTLGSQLTGNIMTNPHRYQYNATSPSFNSDSSTSHSPHDSEKESDPAMYSNSNNNNNNGNQTASNGSNSIRSRSVHTNGTTPAEAVKSSNGTAGVVSNKESVQNALNNNSDISTAGNCTNGMSNDNSSNSNSIWYEYGCV